MSGALSVFYYIWDSIINLVFQTLQIESGVSIGWIIIAVIIIGFITANILSVPRSINASLWNRRGEK